MVTDCAMLEVSSGAGVEDGEENGDNEAELSLELSIGRSYKRSMPENKKSTGSSVKMGAVDRNLFRSGPAEVILVGDAGCEGALDLQSKREIQALKRQEARKKREEKLKKLAHCKGSVNIDEFEARAREIENEDVNFPRKREKIENVGHNCFGNEDMRDLNLALNTGSCSMATGSLFSSVPVAPLQFLDRPIRNAGTYSDTRPCWAPASGNVHRSEEKALMPADGRSFRPYQANTNTVHDDGTDNGSAGCSSSAFSDYQSSPRQGGGSSSESGRSNSSHSTKPKQQRRQQNLIKASAPIPTQHSENTASCSSVPSIKPNQTITKDPKQQTEAAASIEKNTKETFSLPQMPCVSATGNGPNGKTINGLLYRYSKTEVTIVCVCHGTSFSPAGFVEHAGGVDIDHPLKHITVVPSAF